MKTLNVLLPLLALASGCAYDPSAGESAEASAVSLPDAGTSGFYTCCDDSGCNDVPNGTPCGDNGGGGDGGGGIGWGGGTGGNTCTLRSCYPNYCWVTQPNGNGYWYLCTHNASADVDCAVSGCTRCGDATPGSMAPCFAFCDQNNTDGPGSYYLASCYANCAGLMTSTCQ